jgi:heptaprenyl diphosphate synthase
MRNKNELAQIPLLAALASVLQLAEALLPLPFPGVKFGFANLVTLYTLTAVGFNASLQVAVLRCLISSFILGSFLSPSFFLSFSGAITSALVMGLLFYLDKESRFFSLIGISIAGALAHNLTQLAVVSYFFAGHNGVFWLAPWLLLSGGITGYLTGLVCLRVRKRLLRPIRIHSWPAGMIRPPAIDPGMSQEIINTAGAEVKLAIFLVLLVISFLLKNISFYLISLLVIIALLLAYKVPLNKILKHIRRLSWLLIFSFLVNILFNHGKDAGIQAGILSCCRLFLLMLGALFIMHTTSPRTLIAGLRKILRPLRSLGLNPDRAAEYIGLSWEAVPALSQDIQKRFRKFAARKNKKKSLKYLLAFATRTMLTILHQISCRKGSLAYEKTAD